MRAIGMLPYENERWTWMTEVARMCWNRAYEQAVRPAGRRPGAKGAGVAERLVARVRPGRRPRLDASKGRSAS